MIEGIVRQYFLHQFDNNLVDLNDLFPFDLHPSYCGKTNQEIFNLFVHDNLIDCIFNLNNNETIFNLCKNNDNIIDILTYPTQEEILKPDSSGNTILHRLIFDQAGYRLLLLLFNIKKINLDIRNIKDHNFWYYLSSNITVEILQYLIESKRTDFDISLSKRNVKCSTLYAIFSMGGTYLHSPFVYKLLRENNYDLELQRDAVGDEIMTEFSKLRGNSSSIEYYVFIYNARNEYYDRCANFNMSKIDSLIETIIKIGCNYSLVALILYYRQNLLDYIDSHKDIEINDNLRDFKFITC